MDWTTAPRALASLYVLASVLSLCPVAHGGQKQPWPSPVLGFVASKPGEHSRLFFRRGDLPGLWERAKTAQSRLAA